jgi:hypothetical protein
VNLKAGKKMIVKVTKEYYEIDCSSINKGELIPVVEINPDKKYIFKN